MPRSFNLENQDEHQRWLSAKGVFHNDKYIFRLSLFQVGEQQKEG